MVNNVKRHAEITVSSFISTTPLLGHIVVKLNCVSSNKKELNIHYFCAADQDVRCLDSF
jgi:hypothetical protein